MVNVHYMVVGYGILCRSPYPEKLLNAASFSLNAARFSLNAVRLPTECGAYFYLMRYVPSQTWPRPHLGPRFWIQSKAGTREFWGLAARGLKPRARLNNQRYTFNNMQQRNNTIKTITLSTVHNWPNCPKRSLIYRQQHLRGASVFNIYTCVVGYVGKHPKHHTLMQLSGFWV